MAREKHEDEAVYVEDGYFVKRHIARVPRLHGELTFEFRVMQPLQRAEVLAETRDQEEIEVIRRLATVMSHLLKSWDVKDKSGKTVPITADSINKLHPLALNRLHRIVVYHTDGGDAASNEKAAEKPSEYAVPNWMKTADKEVEDLAKNSPTASAS